MSGPAGHVAEMGAVADMAPLPSLGTGRAARPLQRGGKYDGRSHRRGGGEASTMLTPWDLSKALLHPSLRVG